MMAGQHQIPQQIPSQGVMQSGGMLQSGGISQGMLISQQRNLPPTQISNMSNMQPMNYAPMGSNMYMP